MLAGLLVHRFGAAPQLQRLLAAGPRAARHDAVGQEPGRRERAGLRRDLLRRDRRARSRPGARVEDAAALILAGVQFTDLNSGLFSQRITRARTIELGAARRASGRATFAPLELPTHSPRWSRWSPALAGPRPARGHGSAAPAPRPAADDDPLSQAALWQEVAGFLRAGDIVLADQGTCFYGMAPHRLPAGRHVRRPAAVGVDRLHAPRPARQPAPRGRAAAACC